jgi:asparagine synthetase A
VRIRERPAAAAALPVPPLSLRKWQRQPLTGEEGEHGEDVYASREEWRAARAAWAAEHGLTVMQWWEQVADAAAGRARTLDDLNAPYAFLPDDDEDDPRDWTAERIAADKEAMIREAHGPRLGAYPAGDD